MLESLAQHWIWRVNIYQFHVVRGLRAGRNGYKVSKLPFPLG